MNLPHKRDYRSVYGQFRWDVPAHFNFGADVVDAFAAGNWNARG